MDTHASLIPTAAGTLEGMIHLTSAIAPGHLGELHAYEQLLVLLLAFGPFLALAVVVYVVRRRDIAAETAEKPVPGGPEDPGLTGP